MFVESSLTTTLQLFRVERSIWVPWVLCAANVDRKEAAEGGGITWAATCAHSCVFQYPVVADEFKLLSTGVSSRFFVIIVFFFTEFIL